MEERGTVLRPATPVLLILHDLPADLPVGRSQERIHRPGSPPASLFQDRSHVSQKVVVGIRILNLHRW